MMGPKKLADQPARSRLSLAARMMTGALPPYLEAAKTEEPWRNRKPKGGSKARKRK
jgi:hypothetical protein